MLLCIVDYCNKNSGFIMALLTFVYVIATILICVFNYRSAKEAQNQIESGNVIQKQNVDIQLLEMRKRLVFELQDALTEKMIHFTNLLFEYNNEEKYEEKTIVLLNELPYLFQKDDFMFVYEANDCLNETQQCLAKYSNCYSEYVFTYMKDDYKEKLDKFKDITNDYLNNIIDDNNYISLSDTVFAEDLCRCIIEAKRKHSEATELLKKNNIKEVFITKYLSFK